MSTLQRGLDLTRLDEITPEEIEGFRAAYTATQDGQHAGLNFWLENNSSVLKRYRHFAVTMARPPEDEDFFVGFTAFFGIYALTGFARGFRYLIRVYQIRGLSKAQLLEGLAIMFLHLGPRGMETVAEALEGYDWAAVPAGKPNFPAGWEPDPRALSSGIDFSSPQLSASEAKQLEAWYEEKLGEVPPYVRLLLRYQPDLLKAYRSRFETAVRLLPPQIVATSLLSFNTARGFADGIREDLLLAHALGVSRWAAMKMVANAALYGGMECLSIVERAGGDVLERMTER